MNWKLKASIAVTATLLIAAGVVGSVAYKSMRMWNLAWDFESQIRYQMDNGETMGTVSGEEALAVDYLQQIFNDNQELLNKLKAVVKRGITDDKTLKLGQVSSMIVTYHVGEDETGNKKAQDVVAHVLGGFPLGKRKPGFHRDGYFRHLLDKDIWNLGGAAISMVGRDMIMFAEESVADRQKNIVEQLLKYGDISPLVETIREKPMYFTAVFPNPRNVLPIQLRRHIQALVVKGYFSPTKGRAEIILLTPSPRSASYAAAILGDLKKIAEVSLVTKWKAFETQYDYGGTSIETWWSWEMLKNLEKSAIKKEFNIVRLKSDFDRPMVNVCLKTLERMSRDLAQMRGTLDEKLDPRLVDDQLYSRKPQHYWTDSHKYGPNWPFKPEKQDEVLDPGNFNPDPNVGEDSSASIAPIPSDKS